MSRQTGGIDPLTELLKEMVLEAILTSPPDVSGDTACYQCGTPLSHDRECPRGCTESDDYSAGKGFLEGFL